MLGEDAVVIYREVICRQICPPVMVLVGELHGVEFTGRVADLAGRLGDEHNRHALRSVALREVSALGPHAHVMAVEQLLDLTCFRNNHSKNMSHHTHIHENIRDSHHNALAHRLPNTPHRMHHLGN